MAISVTTQPTPSGWMLSSAIGDISADSTAESVAVRLSIAGHTFFSATIAVYGGVATLYDATSVIEDYMRRESLSMAAVTAFFGDESTSLYVQYCSVLLPATFDPADTFLSLAGVTRTHRGSHIALSVLPRTDRTVSLKGVSHDASGIPSVSEAELAKTFPVGGGTLYLPVDGLVSALGGADYLAVSCGGLRRMVFIDRHPFFLLFKFRNVFNVPELLDVACTVETETEAGGSTAVCGGILSRYDITVTRSFTVKTSPLTTAQAEALSQMVASHSVQLCAGDDDFDVVITDSECKDTTDDSSPVTYSFTFRFASGRVRILDTAGLMPSRKRVFDSNYAMEFA